MQDPEKEGQTEKQIKNQNQKTPRGHSSKQAKPVYIPTGYESLRSSGQSASRRTANNRTDNTGTNKTVGRRGRQSVIPSSPPGDPRSAGLR